MKQRFERVQEYDECSCDCEARVAADAAAGGIYRGLAMIHEPSLSLPPPLFLRIRLSSSTFNLLKLSAAGVISS